MQQDAFDIAVIGQGLVGASFVLALHQLVGALPAQQMSQAAQSALDKQMRVLHIDAGPQQSQNTSSDERHLALNAHSLDSLQKLQVELSPAQCSAIERVHISRVGDFGRVLLDATEEGVPHFGRLVPASLLRSALDGALRNLPSAFLDRRFETTLGAMQLIDDGYQLQLNSAEGVQTVNARFVVGADGTDSAVRQLMARFDALPAVDDSYVYEQVALSFNISAERAHEGTAFERFSDHGPIAVLPLPNRRVGVIWTLPEAQAQQALALRDADFVAQFQRAFGYRLGRFEKPGKRTLWPLRRLRAHPDIAERCALIGNAAQTIHPLGAQGFNLGLRDAQALASMVARGQFTRDDLQAFSKQRKKDRADTLRFSDSGLVATQNSSVPAKWLRQFAWGALEALPLAKRSLTRFGLGRSRAAV